jgi:hypothetical protein
MYMQGCQRHHTSNEKMTTTVKILVCVHQCMSPSPSAFCHPYVGGLLYVASSRNVCCFLSCPDEGLSKKKAEGFAIPHGLYYVL